MKKIIIAITLLLITISACRTMQVKKVDYSKIDDPAYLACIKTRTDFYYQKGYLPTDKGFENIKAFCYITLKAAGVLK